MTRFGDRLEQAKYRPALVADAVRTAMHDAIAWRIGGGAAPNSAAFTTAAIAAARLMLDASQSDGAQCSRTLAAVARAAAKLTASTLYDRLMRVPASRFLRQPVSTDGPDVIVRDRRRRIHAITLTAKQDALDAGRIATAVARATTLSAADRLSPICVHVYSLTTGHRQMFERETRPCRPSLAMVRVA